MSRKRPSLKKPKRRFGGFKPIRTIWISENIKTFIDEFQVGTGLGRGQFGSVYRVRRKADKKIMVAKAIKKARFHRFDGAISNSQRSSIFASMEGEINILLRNSEKHDNIIAITDIHEDKHILYIIMPQCRGPTLLQRIKNMHNHTLAIQNDPSLVTLNGNFKDIIYNERYVSQIIKMILSAIHFMFDLHRVHHGNLKPENILFFQNTKDSLIKVCDFGMAAVLSKMKNVTQLVNVNFHHYMAPEAITDRKRFGHLSDCWSVGVIMFIMLYGYPPFYVHPKENYGQSEITATYTQVKL